MIRDINLQIISGYGWYEIIAGHIKTRREGELGLLGEVIPARVHVHEDGIAITGLPPSALEWLLKSIEHETTHDCNGNTKDGQEKPVMITIRAA